MKSKATKAALEMNRTRWKRKSKAERSASARHAILRRWHRSDCIVLGGLAVCACRQSRQVPIVGSKPEGGNS